VSVGQLRSGELLAAAGAVVLLVSLFLEWFGPGGVSGWDGLGWVTLACAVATMACALWLVAATLADRPVTQIVGAGVLAATVGSIGFVVVALRALVFQPGPNEVVGLRYGAYLGVVSALTVAIGAWRSLSDERTDLPENAYIPPPARPAPPG
jgi:hypothetical protein